MICVNAGELGSGGCVKRLAGLDALRGIAALLVVIHHFTATTSGQSIIAPGLAVDLFFILSGFVMARTYEARMRKGLTTPRFLWLRYKRLWLPVAVGSTLGLAYAIGRYPYPFSELTAAFALALVFMPAWWLPSAFALNVPAWSLFLEILANALHGAALWRLNDRALIGLWAVSAAVFCGAFLAGHGHWGRDIGSILWLIPRELSCYLVGILIFRLYDDRPLGNQPLVAIALFSPLLLLAPLHPAIELAAVLIAFPLLIRGSLGLPESQWAAWAGALSYPLYATHVPVMKLASLAGYSPFVRLASTLMVAAAVAVAFWMMRAVPLKVAKPLPQ